MKKHIRELINCIVILSCYNYYLAAYEFHDMNLKPKTLQYVTENETENETENRSLELVEMKWRNNSFFVRHHQ